MIKTKKIIGVCLSHAQILNFMHRFHMINSNDTLFGFSSLYWLSGVIVLLLGTLSGATRVITAQTFSSELQLHLIEKYRITFTLNATHQLILITKSDRFRQTDLSSWRIQMVGGSKVPFHLKCDLIDLIPNGNIMVAYGMSETGVITLDYPLVRSKDTVGRLNGTCCAKIVDENGMRCGPNVDGEICIKTDYKFPGYYGDEKGTKEFFDDEDFVKTGDIGHFDEDGDLFVVDRKKELLKYCNFQISPSEIDSFLTESPQINSACVVGIPDDVATDLPAAVIVRENGSKITEQEVFQMVAGNEIAYKFN